MGGPRGSQQRRRGRKREGVSEWKGETRLDRRLIGYRGWRSVELEGLCMAEHADGRQLLLGALLCFPAGTPVRTPLLARYLPVRSSQQQACFPPLHFWKCFLVPAGAVGAQR